jgi:hypothetical protein
VEIVEALSGGDVVEGDADRIPEVIDGPRPIFRSLFLTLAKTGSMGSRSGL